MHVQKKNEVFSMSQRSRLSSIKTSGDLSTKKKQQNRLQKYFPRGGKKLVSCYPGVAFDTPWLQACTEKTVADLLIIDLIFTGESL